MFTQKTRQGCSNRGSALKLCRKIAPAERCAGSKSSPGHEVRVLGDDLVDAASSPTWALAAVSSLQ